MQFLTEEHWAALLEAARVGAEEMEKRAGNLWDYTAEERESLKQRAALVRDVLSPAPINAGRPWAYREDLILCAEYDSGISIKELAKRHRRSAWAIEARLVRLGKMPA